MTEELKKKLIELALKYEVSAFCENDPSQFLRWYKPETKENPVCACVADVETAAFLAAMLAFGSRRQFIPKIKEILTLADSTSGTITRWLITGTYKKTFPSGTKKFYRFYSYDDMQIFFEELAELLMCVKREEKPGTEQSNTKETEFASLGNFFRKHKTKDKELSAVIAEAFPKSAIVPKGHNGANKRIHMFLRWMVRRNSPVDLGLWQWVDPAELLIPLDVHVMQEAQRLGLIVPGAAATRKTALQLTEQMAQVFPSDPCRGDFALFGLGIDSIM